MTGASKDQIKEWLTVSDPTIRWVIIAHDTFDMEDYPIYVQIGDNPKDRMTTNRGDLADSYHEVYDLLIDLDSQLAEKRAWHIEDSPPIPKEDIVPSRKPHVDADEAVRYAILRLIANLEEDNIDEHVLEFHNSLSSLGYQVHCSDEIARLDIESRAYNEALHTPRSRGGLSAT